jgi:hypothetical protein
MHNYHLKQTFIELAVQWPTGLNNLLDIAPGLLTTRDKEGKGLLELAITWSDMSCPEDNTPIMDCPTACNNCTCSESFEILLNHKCFLSSKDVHDALSYGSRGVRSALIRHLSQWRSKLQDVLREHLPEHCQSAMNGLALLDSEAPRAIANLKRIDVDPYELWGLEQGDYRLGPTPCTDAPQPTIFSNIKDSETAQMAFDVGFRDIDVLFEGSTPLATASRKPSSQLIGYCPWLIRHGADLNRKIPHIDKENVQQKAVAKIPDHLVLHQAAKSLALWLNMGYYKRIEDAELLSWWGPLVASSTYAGGCMCACSPKSRGCYPLTVLLNYHLLKHPKSAPWHWNDPVIDYLTDGNTSLGLVEIIIQSFTFYRLEIRHTCCASIGVRDNELLFVCSDDFEDLRAEDAERVKLLNHIVAEFMEQYRQEGLSLSSFIKGTWAKRMDMLAAEETKAKWSAAEREAVILAGVIPIDEDCDEMEKTASESDTESKDSPSVLESYFEEINFIVDGRTATQ